MNNDTPEVIITQNDNPPLQESHPDTSIPAAEEESRTDEPLEEPDDGDETSAISSDSDTEIDTKYDTLVLPGGGIKGLLILGALQNCYDNFLLTDIVNYVGTSSGAMTCYLMAIGYTPIDIVTYICCYQIMEKMQHFDLFAMMNNLGATSFSSVSEVLEKMTIDKIGYLPTLLDIKQQYNKNLVFVTYNLTKHSEEYLNYETHPTLPCLVALRMSANLPLVFENYKYNSNLYIDGGMTNNLAIDVGEKIGTKVLALYINYLDYSFSSNNNILEFIYKLMYIPIIQLQRNKLEKADKSKCHILYLTDTMVVKMFDFSISTTEKLELFSSGYRQVKNTKL
jgi:predicted patatin/cPLA2 family phospholipase